jgi:hypothetical protein
MMASSPIFLIISLALFAAGIGIAAARHWLWALPVCLLPPLVFKIFFMADVVDKIAANEAAPIENITLFLSAGPVGVAIGAIIKVLK